MENTKYVINKYDTGFKAEPEPVNKNKIKREFTEEFLIKVYEQFEQEFNEEIASEHFIGVFDKDIKNNIRKKYANGCGMEIKGELKDNIYKLKCKIGIKFLIEMFAMSRKDKIELIDALDKQRIEIVINTEQVRVKVDEKYESLVEKYKKRYN